MTDEELLKIAKHAEELLPAMRNYLLGRPTERHILHSMAFNTYDWSTVITVLQTVTEQLAENARLRAALQSKESKQLLTDHTN